MFMHVYTKQTCSTPGAVLLAVEEKGSELKGSCPLNGSASVMEMVLALGSGTVVLPKGSLLKKSLLLPPALATAELED